MNEEIMNWLEDIWTMHQYDLENESWKLRTNKPEMMIFGESNWKDYWIAPDGWKEFSQSKTIMRMAWS